LKILTWAESNTQFISVPNLISGNRFGLLKIEKLQKATMNILTRARRSLLASRRTRAESIAPLSSTQKYLLFIFLIRTLPHFPDRIFEKGRTRASFQFSPTMGGDIFTFVCLHDKTRALWTRVDLCYHRGASPVCVGELFEHL
jgi:hypothetical protein